MAEVQACPDVSHLQRLLDGLLIEQDQAELNAHLEQCATCQQRLDELIAGQGFWSDVARNLKSAHSEIEAGTATRYAARSGESPDQADDDLTLEFLEHSHKPDSLGRLGHYEVLEVIGRGGMGIVLRAFDEKLHRIVAIKVMAPRLAATSPPRKRFLREARAAAQVRHEHVVDIHAVEEQPIPHLVMEYVPGESLQQRLNRIGPLEVPDVLRIGQQIARGLAAAHAQGLIHRDVKPGNILLEKGVEERVKITDFGLARAADDASLTQSGMIAGTPLFMAPEQAQGGVIDHRADLFSLGSVLYTMCSGRPPFRASTSLAVLKRVVEDAPRPIQEIIPEVPQWLCDIIAKLHAKRPEDRFQSAKEVADLLGQCLAHPQHSPGGDFGFRISDCGLEVPQPNPSAICNPQSAIPSTKSAIRNPQSAIHWRPWLIAATALLLLFCVLSLSEATGVTQFAATVIHLLTPQGTLVIETNDPDVNVTIEGDGGLVITGAGLHEVRLKPGSYQLKADKNGQPVKLDQDLVTITRGDKQVVRVRLEIQPASAAVPKVETGAFVLLSGKEVEVRKFDTLAEAVQAASDGDTIEIRGNGPFLSAPVNLERTALTIRAAAGFRPVIKLSPEAVPRKGFLLTSMAALVLEGLELHRAPPEDPNTWGWEVVHVREAPLRAVNCRFRGSVFTIRSPVCVFRNCEFLASTGALGGLYGPGARVHVDNCLFWAKWNAMGLQSDDAAVHDISFQIQRSSLVSGINSFTLLHGPLPLPSDRPQDTDTIRLDVSGCVFDGPNVLNSFHPQRFPGKAAGLEPAEAEAALLRRLQWRGKRNLFASGSTSVRWVDFKVQPPHGPKRLEEWKQFWETAEADSLEGSLRFQGGNLRARTEAALDQLTPGDFRLRADSPGYRAGPDGKDLGADVDLVGPGEAYERWKQTPEYQEWLKETGQVKE